MKVIPTLILLILGAFAIVQKEYDTDWLQVQLKSVKLSDNGRAFYLVQYTEANKNAARIRGKKEWVPAQKVRNKYYACDLCPPLTYIPQPSWTYENSFSVS